MIAAEFDLQRFNSKAMYVIGTVCSKTSTPQSDVDLLIVFDGDDSLKRELFAWFEGWSLSLSERMYKRTGYKIHNFIDLVLISSEELEENVYYKRILKSGTNEAIKLK